MRKLLSALLVLSAPALAFGDEAVKVAVVPFTPLTGDVPNNAGSKAAEVLLTSLKAHENLAPQDASGGAADDPAAHLKKANELLLSARKKLEAGQPHAAKAELEQCVAEFGAGAAAMEDPDSLADAYSALSRAHYQTGDDAKGLAALAAAEALHPGKDLLEARQSALFAGLAAKEKEKVLGADKATLRINSVPPGASARIDGLDAGRTPVVVKDLVPGPHVWRVDLPTGGSVGGTVEVKAGQKAEVAGSASGHGPAAPLVSAVAGNALGGEAVKAMKEAASGLEASFVVFGGLHAEGSDLVLDSFVYSSKANAFARLPKVKFDADLVSAGQALDQIANEVAGRASSGTLGAQASVPAKVSDQVAAADLSEVSEFRFPAPGSEAAPKKETGPRKVVGARKGPVTKQQ